MSTKSTGTRIVDPQSPDLDALRYATRLSLMSAKEASEEGKLLYPGIGTAAELYVPNLDWNWSIGRDDKCRRVAPRVDDCRSV